MKKLLFLLLMPFLAFCQSDSLNVVDWQTEVLTRPTAMPCYMTSSIQEFRGILANNDVDYIIIDNSDTVNVFYYHEGELNTLRPGTSDLFLAVRDQFDRVVRYPYLFFDNSTYGRKVSMRIGLCANCQNSSIGVQFGYTSPTSAFDSAQAPKWFLNKYYEANSSKTGFYR